MNVKWIGAILTIFACGFFGFQTANAHKRQERSLQQLIQILARMKWELEYRLTPLPELCALVAHQSKISLGRFFRLLSAELDGQAAPNVCQCMQSVLSKAGDQPKLTVQALTLLAESLGQYDLSGQLKSLEAVERFCEHELDKLGYHREERLRSYRVLGICAGIALAILFI